MSPLLDLDLLVPILDGDPIAADQYMQHYASDKSRALRLERGTLLTLGPGEKLVLSTPCRRAHFAWRRFIDDCLDAEGEKQGGVNCAWFFNASPLLASDLIRAADAIAYQKWPGQRHYTYVDPRRVRGNPPGNVFRRAGWREVGRTKMRELLILERSPQ